MDRRIEQRAGIWWRATRYELRDGFICVAKGARIEHFDVVVGAPDLAEFVALADTSPYTEIGRATLLRFCSRFGLLGILPHRLVRVAFWPQYRAHSSGKVIAWQRTFHWTFLYGRESRDPELDLEEMRKRRMPLTARLVDGEPGPVPRERWFEYFEPPGALLRDLFGEQHGGEKLDWEPLSEGWSCFFPDVPRVEAETFDYPGPVNPEFWKFYGEPVDVFMRVVAEIREIFDALAKQRVTLPRAPKAVSLPHVLRWMDTPRKIRDPLEKLNSLIAPTRAALGIAPDGRLRRYWIANSLLGAIAVRILEQLGERQYQPKHCLNCGKLIIVGDRRALYCNDTCSDTAKKRRQRERERRKRRSPSRKKRGGEKEKKA